jgi:hypothetical protein
VLGKDYPLYFTDKKSFLELLNNTPTELVWELPEHDKISIIDNARLNEELLEIENTLFFVDTSMGDMDLVLSTIKPMEPGENDWIISIPVKIAGREVVRTDLYYEYSPPEQSVDFLLYKASDGFSQSGISIATLVNGRDEDWRDRFIVPTALDDNISMQEDGVQEINFVGFDLFASIPQNNDALDILSGPNNGTITDPELASSSTAQLTQWIANYTPNLNFSGTDEIIYTVTNGIGVMQAWENILSKEEIEAIAYYVFNSANK